MLPAGLRGCARSVWLKLFRYTTARRVERAQMLLSYREKLSFFAVGQRLGVHPQVVQRCVERSLAYGPLAALNDRPRPGKEPMITPQAEAWLVSLACGKAKDHEVLDRIADHPINRIGELLPWNISMRSSMRAAALI
jgi:hypothetical protein